MLHNNGNGTLDQYKKFRSIFHRMVDYIEENHMLDGAKKVYVAVSGGADSMALLCMMKEFIRHPIELAAVHVNHGLRGETADRDMYFVEEYCKKANIEFICFDASRDGTHIPADASEEWARLLRYNYFSCLLGEGCVLATAHTMSDQIETMLFKLSRGTGLKGMAGIPGKRGKYIRPMLCLTRADIEELISYYGCGHITDETNLTDAYARNKLRHHVVPVLKSINSNAERNFSKAAERVYQANEYIQRQVELQFQKIKRGAYEYSLEEIRKGSVDSFIEKEIYIKILDSLGSLSEYNLELFMGAVSDTNEIGCDYFSTINIGKNLQLAVSYSSVIVNNLNDGGIYNELVQGINHCRHFSFCVSEVERADFHKSIEENGNTDLKWYADTNKLDISKCIVRYAEDGERFRPACRMEKKVRSFLKEMNIPIILRDKVPCIEYEGKIIWVYGVGFTDGFIDPLNTSNSLIKII